MIIINTKDARLSRIDDSDPMGKKLLRDARKSYNGDKEAHGRLVENMKSLNTGLLNHLCVMWMVSDKYCGATGQGGIWAAASEIINNEARNILKNRPLFEIIDEPFEPSVTKKSNRPKCNNELLTVSICGKPIDERFVGKESIYQLCPECAIELQIDI